MPSALFILVSNLIHHGWGGGDVPLALSWLFWSLAAALLLIGWRETLTHGQKNATAWTICAVANLAAIVSAIRLVKN